MSRNTRLHGSQRKDRNRRASTVSPAGQPLCPWLGESPEGCLECRHPALAKALGHWTFRAAQRGNHRRMNRARVTYTGRSYGLVVLKTCLTEKALEITHEEEYPGEEGFIDEAVVGRWRCSARRIKMAKLSGKG
jgi:hypothetical protein